MKWSISRRHRAVVAMWTISGATIAPALVGCGGGAAVAPESSLQVRVQWPDASRLIPSGTQSLRVVVQDSGGFQTFRTANKPATGTFTTLVFFGLKPGPIQVEASAFPAPDAQGVALASTSVQVTLASGVQTNLQLSLNSTVDRIEVSPTRLDLRPGSAQTLSGVAKDSSGNLVPLTTSKTTWTSSDGTIATVDSAGKVTAVKEGSATITFRDTESGKAGTALVVASNSVAGVIDHVQVTPASNPLTVGQNAFLTATLRDALNNALPSQPGTWSSSDIATASVDSAGKVTALKEGSATITFKETASGKAGSATVTITKPVVASVSINPASTTLVLGEQTTLQALLRSGSNAILPLEPGTWQSSAPGVVSVDPNGKITALALTVSPVLITFTHTATGLSGSASITVGGTL